MTIATAQACVNIALIKYWGKRDETLHLPTNNSISLTLNELYSTTSVAFEPDLPEDIYWRDGHPRNGEEAFKVTRFLDLVRNQAQIEHRARVITRNTVPTAAGLASSASGFAALAAAASKAAGISTAANDLSCLARRGSGSACRSVFGGFVEWQKGQREDGADSHGVPLSNLNGWELRLVVTQLSSAPKERSSRDGMRDTVNTSPFYAGWLASIDDDLIAARKAIARQDLPALGTTAERNALKMHATMLGAEPPFTYWLPASVAAMRTVWDLRKRGVPAWLTMDAGPNVKVLTTEHHTQAISQALRETPGVEGVVVCTPGPGVRWLDTPLEA
ncbi:MAG: diphosphomevalonate decarboxylase [Candidatus Sericytochromatia bacterium]|nr:diphosphomevalonate decarboxylase [Candidatus Sericytochromatia bacterium]